MAVHAHPDDEATGTGGILAKYAAEGFRTVLVTCTDGGCGDGPGGIKPGDAGHDPVAVAALRKAELQASCQVLGVTDLEMLGYADSGMMGWAMNNAPGAFWTTPVDTAAAQLADLMRIYQPDVVVTYDANGFYGHPDHIQAHRITMAAVEASGIPAKVYWTAIAASEMATFEQRLRDVGVEFPAPDPDAPPPADGEGFPPGTPDEDVTTRVDATAFADQKFDALAAHSSQGDNIFFLRMGKDAFASIMGVESFVRAHDRTGAPTPEDDLFAGLR
ncbi:MAG: LmbE family protein [Pseudonocardiales bacterium]|nr:LmbE family protein [Jatrophihabitantaceae bacterium]MCW2603913.1 LmbE family protein [Pseudonocardiales bacterium]